MVTHRFCNKQDLDYFSGFENNLHVCKERLALDITSTFLEEKKNAVIYWPPCLGRIIPSVAATYPCFCCNDL